MDKKIIISTMLVLTLLLLIPINSNVSAYDEIDEIDFCFIRGWYKSIEENENGYKITCNRRAMTVKGYDVHPELELLGYDYYFTRNFIEINIPPFRGIKTPNFIWGIASYMF